MLAGIGPTRWLFARFLQSGKIKTTSQLDKYDEMIMISGTYSSNNCSSFPSSGGMVPTSSLSFSCLRDSKNPLKR